VEQENIRITRVNGYSVFFIGFTVDFFRNWVYSICFNNSTSYRSALPLCLSKETRANGGLYLVFPLAPARFGRDGSRRITWLIVKMGIGAFSFMFVLLMFWIYIEMFKDYNGTSCKLAPTGKGTGFKLASTGSYMTISYVSPFCYRFAQSNCSLCTKHSRL